MIRLKSMIMRIEIKAQPPEGQPGLAGIHTRETDRRIENVNDKGMGISSDKT